MLRSSSPVKKGTNPFEGTVKTFKRQCPEGVSPLFQRAFSQHRSGFTLLEVILVLAVIGVFTGMALPSVVRMFRQQKLIASAERVREAIASTRIRAIESGLVYQFCCEANGIHYVVVPFEPDHVLSSGGSMTNAGNQPAVIPASRAMGALPSGVSFSSEVIGNLGVSANGLGPMQMAPGSLDGLPNGAALAGLSWSTPILFKPDGSASADTELTVSDTRSQQIRLRIRALTGAVSMERLVVGKHK